MLKEDAQSGNKELTLARVANTMVGEREATANALFTRKEEPTLARVAASTVGVMEVGN